MKQLLVVGFGLMVCQVQAQLVVQNGATLFVDAGATVTVQGDLTSNANITGTGKIVMKGSGVQNLSMNGFSIPNLDIDNVNNVVLNSPTVVTGALGFINGKLQLGNNNFTLGTAGTIVGTPGTNKFAETNGTGEFKRQVAAVGNVIIPVGSGSDYTPVTFQLAGNTFSSGLVGARAVNGGHPNKHPRSTDFLNTYWSLSRSGITGGTVVVEGTYVDPTDVSGAESDIRSMAFSGGNWALGTGQDNAANTITAPLAGNSSDLYAMNRFVLNTPKVFLQGAFNTSTGLMSDLLRNSTGTYSPGNLPVSNLIPLSDPYRTAPYNGSFTHVNNSVAESLTSNTVLNDLANTQDQIVDWIFIELRNSTTPGNVVVQTRSALLQKDGDVVDIDGISPVYFKNVDAGNYALVVRHRNHLAMSQNPSTPVALNLSNTIFDFTNIANASLLGVPGTAFVQDGVSVKNLLWSGNASMNSNIRFGGPANDKDFLLGTGLSGNAAVVLSNVYNVSDLNMNRIVRFGGPSNDKDFLLNTPLISNASLIRTQVLPN